MDLEKKLMTYTERLYNMVRWGKHEMDLLEEIGVFLQENSPNKEFCDFEF